MIMNDIINIIKESKKIGITFHASPDGDALGSSLSLMQGLQQLDKEVYILSKDNVPENYKFLPSAQFVNAENYKVKEETQCVIVLDCGNIDRISGELDFNSRKYNIINIDHHLSNELYGDLNYVDTNASAVGEIIYQLMRLMGITIDKDMAICLYTSLVTDNGGFKHSNTTSVTHTIAGDLINTGIDFSEIHRVIFENKPLKRVKLYGKVIDSLTLIHNNKCCVMELTNDMLNELGIEATDTSDIISIGMEIDSVEVAVLFKESSNGTKISLRSKKHIDVRKIAEGFGGGGHTKASGLFIPKGIKDSKEILIKSLEEELIKWTE